MKYQLHLIDDNYESCYFVEFDYSYYDVVKGARNGSLMRALGGKLMDMIRKDLYDKHEAGVLPPEEYKPRVDPNQMTIDDMLGGALNENTQDRRNDGKY